MPAKLSAAESEPNLADETTPLIHPKDGLSSAEVLETVSLKEQSTAQQLLSAPFAAQTAFFCWGMLHQNFYLATIGDQINMIAGDSKNDQEEAGDILGQFAFFYPIRCILAILPVGALVRNTTVSTSIYTYCAATLIFSALLLVPIVRFTLSFKWASLL